MKITSVNNELVKDTAKLLRGKYREETGLFLIEGEKAVKEAIESGIVIVNIFKLEGYNEINYDNCIETTESVLNKISDAKSAPKVVAVAKQLNYSKEQFCNYKRVVLLEGIKDAGNLGTILRTAAAFGVDGVVLYGETVDLYNPKCVRSAVGNLWKIPVIEIKDFSDLQELFGGYERIATLPRTNNYLKTFDAKLPCVVMFGSEADGLSEELVNFSTNSVKIEMASTVESLNLSVSCAVVLYKLFV